MAVASAIIRPRTLPHVLRTREAERRFSPGAEEDIHGRSRHGVEEPRGA